MASGSLVGIWHGRIHFDMSKLPSLKNPRQNSARLAGLRKLEQYSLTLTLKGDHSYTLLTSGGPKGGPQVNGKWTVLGSSLSLQQMAQGQERGYPLVYTIDRSEKSFSVTKDQSGISTTVTFYK